jgi:hypothetical protein
MVFEIQYSDGYVKKAETLKFLLKLSFKKVKVVKLIRNVQDNIFQLVLRTNKTSHSTYSKKGLNLLLQNLSTDINKEIEIIKEIMIS